MTILKSGERLTGEAVAELRAAAEKATPGPWRSIIDDTGGEWSGWPLCIVSENEDDRSVVRTGGLWPYEWDPKVSQFEAVATAEFIALANPATILALLDSIPAPTPAAIEPEAGVQRGPLSWLAENINVELSYGYGEEEGGEGRWQVHRVNGGRSDREWTLIGEGSTPEAALAKAESLT